MEGYVERHLRWNFVAGAGEAVFYWLSMASFASATAVVPLYMRHLTASPTLIALAVAIPEIGWFLPQLLTVPLVERMPRKLPFVKWTSLFSERTGFLFMAVAAFFFGRSRPEIAVPAILLALCWNGFGMGLLGTGWQDIIAKVIPVRLRGRFFAAGDFAGAVLGIPGAMLAGLILGRLAYPTNFALCFLAAFGTALISWGFMASIREPAGQPVLYPPGVQLYLRRLAQTLRADGNFARFLLSHILITLGGIAYGFFAVSAASRLGLPDLVAGQFAAFGIAGRLSATLLAGFLGDRYGHKLTLGLAALAAAGAVASAFVGRSAAWFDLAFALQGAAGASMYLAGTSIIFEFCAPEVRPTYIGLASTTVGLASMTVPFLGGALAGRLGYSGLFVVALAVILMGWGVLLLGVKDPRHRAAPGMPPALEGLGRES